MPEEGLEAEEQRLEEGDRGERNQVAGRPESGPGKADCGVGLDVGPERRPWEAPVGLDEPSWMRLVEEASYRTEVMER